MNVLGLMIILTCTCISWVYSLECHVCESHNGNRNECRTETVKCEKDQNVCLSEIRSRNSWIDEGDFTYYIAKKCAKKVHCEEMQKMAKSADFIGQEWVCYDCCQHDYCNFSPKSCFHHI